MDTLDPISLSRLLFATTAGLHYLFVATTLGLAPVIAVVNTAVAVRRGPVRDGLLAVLGRVYLANYGIGIVTGLVMELQMALLWTGPGALEYDPIAAMLALETVVAFFIESTLLGMWIAGANLLLAWVRAIIFWGVTITAYASATFIIGANSQLHAPLEFSAGPFALADVVALVARPAAITPLLHIVASSLVVGGFWLAAIGVRWLRGGGEPAIGRSALRWGAGIVAVAAPLTVISGFAQFPFVRPGLLVSDEGGVFGVALALMMAIGMLILLGTWTFVVPLVFSGAVFRWRWTWPIFAGGVAIPLATTFLGWLYREEARQPWFMVGRVTVEQAASPLPLAQLMAASIVFVALCLTAAVLGWRLMARVARPDARASAEVWTEPTLSWS